MISCLTVTREARFASLERAVADFVRQTWSERELVIVHDGDAAFDARLTALAVSHDAAEIAVHRQGGTRTLGELRNAAVDGSIVRGSGILSGSYERRADDGWSANDDFSQDSAMLDARWRPGARFSIGLAGRYTKYDLGVPMNLNAAGTALVPSLQRRQSGNERQIAIPLTPVRLKCALLGLTTLKVALHKAKGTPLPDGLAGFDELELT